MNIVELFTRGKRLQRAATAKVGEEIEVITIDKSDSEFEYEMYDSSLDSSSRSGNRGGRVPTSNCSQSDGDCNDSSRDDEEKDRGEDLVRYR